MACAPVRTVDQKQHCVLTLLCVSVVSFSLPITSHTNLFGVFLRFACFCHCLLGGFRVVLGSLRELVVEFVGHHEQARCGAVFLRRLVIALRFRQSAGGFGVGRFCFAAQSVRLLSGLLHVVELLDPRFAVFVGRFVRFKGRVHLQYG